jgi:dihydroorotate dehydrogenase electron transfer subunit
MAKRQTAVLRRATPTPPNWEVTFEVEFPPAVGQFVLADLGEALLIPLFPSHVDEGAFTTVVPPRHAATHPLPGTRVALLGPLGRGFRVRAATRLLLVADTRGIHPLRPLLQAANSVALILEAPTGARLPSTSRFPPNVEIHTLTHDGTAGHPGALEGEGSPLPSLVKWADRLCLSCDGERYPDLAGVVRTARLNPGGDFAQALVRVAMPCGVGACEACRVSTRHGEKRACTDGPVFDLLELVP